MNKEEAKTKLIEVLLEQVDQLSIMSKIELGDDVIEEIKRLKDIINEEYQHYLNEFDSLDPIEKLCSGTIMVGSFHPYRTFTLEEFNNRIKEYPDFAENGDQNNMEKLFVNYEIALKLKELGFDEECLRYYTVHDKSLTHIQSTALRQISAPLYQQVIDFFREKHGIEIVVIPDASSESRLPTRKYCYTIFIPVNGANIQPKIGRDENKKIKYYLYPINALNEAISEAIKLIYESSNNSNG